MVKKYVAPCPAGLPGYFWQKCGNRSEANAHAAPSVYHIHTCGKSMVSLVQITFATMTDLQKELLEATPSFCLAKTVD